MKKYDNPLYHVNNFAKTQSGAGYKVRASYYDDDANGWRSVDLYLKDATTLTEEDIKKGAAYAALKPAKNGGEVLVIVVPKEYKYVDADKVAEELDKEDGKTAKKTTGKKPASRAHLDEMADANDIPF